MSQIAILFDWNTDYSADNVFLKGCVYASHTRFFSRVCSMGVHVTLILNSIDVNKIENVRFVQCIVIF